MQCGAEKLIRLIVMCCLGLWAQSVSAADLQVSGHLHLHFEDDRFGGLSGVEVSSDGTELTIVSDKGHLFFAQITRDAGQLSDITITGPQPLMDAQGKRLPGLSRDAEGLTMTPGGMLVASFEHNHRLVRLDPADGTTRPLPLSPAFAAFGKNSGIEALAATATGTFIAIPERSGDREKPFPLLMLTGGTWTNGPTLTRRGPFLPTGADIGPDGRLYLLERTISPLGFRSRIRSFDLDKTDLDERTHWITGPGVFDNLEAIAVWRDLAGKVRVIVLSDDNFLRIQRTEMIELVLQE